MKQMFFVKSHDQPVCAPIDVKPFLGDPELHWKPHGSAWKLAHRWVEANGLPEAVEGLLASSPETAGAQLVEGTFEFDVDLRTPGRKSQTDLMALIATDNGPTIVAIEGKVRESFGPRVAQWLPLEAPAAGRFARLARLCEVLELSPQNCGPLRYQLFHRTVSAVFEAENRGLDRAVMLVHSFCPEQRSKADFNAFLAAMGVPAIVGDGLTPAVCRGGVQLSFGWLTDA